MRQHTAVLIVLLQGLYCLAGGVARGAVTTVVPSGTKFHVRLSSPIDSDTIKDGEPIEAKTVKDIDVDGKLAIPKGSQILGQIIKSDLPPRLRRNCFALYFNRISLGSRRIEPAVIRTWDTGGVVKLTRDGQELRFNVGTRLGCGGMCFSPQKPTFEEGRLGKSTIFTPRRNETVHLHPNDELRVELLEDLRLLE